MNIPEIILVIYLITTSLVVLVVIKRIRKQIRTIRVFVYDFNQYFIPENDKYYTNSIYQSWLESKTIIPVPHKIIRYLLLPKSRYIIAIYNQIIDGTKVKKINEEIVDRKITEHNLFLQNLAPFDDDQLKAIIHDEENNLVIAGAGSGKTSVIIGKAAYINKILGVDSKRLLILAFTKKAVDNLQKKLEGICLGELQVQTFHSFGYDVISEVNYKKGIAFGDKNKRELYDFVEKVIKKLIKSDPDFHSRVYKQFQYYIDNEYVLEEDSEFKTRNGDNVKSYQELIIANFLSANNIKYDYEKKYDIDTASKKHQQYKPDFYLTDYKIYIEHLAIDKEGQPPKNWPYKERKKYLEGIQWKRETHKKHKTNLIETYSADFDNGEFIEKFKSLLISNGVPVNDDQSMETIFKMYNGEKSFYYLFTHLMIRFLNLFRSNNYTIEKLQNNNSRILLEKANNFISIFMKVHWEYEEHLRSNDKIDFSDMIRKSEELLRNGDVNRQYDYILVDEFQDISLGRYDILSALRKQNPKLKLFCVGDDWQSIYGFTGSDVNLFYLFSDYFGFTKKCKLQTTYRFSHNLCKLSQEFITKNPDQISKSLKSNKSKHDKPFEVINYNYEIEEAFDVILEYINLQIEQTSILFLARYNETIKKHRNVLKRLKQKYKQLYSIDYMTIHKAKGIESDYVVLLDPIESKENGFPSMINNDDVFDLVLQSKEKYPFAEERRLFYVALTRAKNKLFIVSGFKDNNSRFVKEIINDYKKIIHHTECNNNRLNTTDVRKKDLRLYAYRYHSLGFRITCMSDKTNKFNIYSKNPFKAPEHRWKHLFSETQSKKDIESYNWTRATGVGCVTGVNDIIAIDIDGCTDLDFIEIVLKSIGLPGDYEWTICSGSRNGYHIIVKVEKPDYLDEDEVVMTFPPKKQFTDLFDKIEILWKTNLVLPPSLHSSGQLYAFVFCHKPEHQPRTISLGNTKSCYYNENNSEMVITEADNGELVGEIKKIASLYNLIDKFLDHDKIIIGEAYGEIEHQLNPKV